MKNPQVMPGDNFSNFLYRSTSDFAMIKTDLIQCFPGAENRCARYSPLMLYLQDGHCRKCLLSDGSKAALSSILEQPQFA